MTYPPLMLAHLQAEFETGEREEEELENSDGEGRGETLESDEELSERIVNLEAELAAMTGRARGKAALRRAIAETKRELAARSLTGQLQWLLNDDKLIARHKESWLSDKATGELDYPLFFAVSQKGGKNNSGEPIYRRDISEEPMLDDHGHLIVEHDLDEIAESFVAFAKEQGFDFWV